MKEKKYESAVVRAARENHIWLNAFSCVRPTTEFKLRLAETILAWLNDKDQLIYPFQDSTNKDMREIGKLTPELILRINKS